MSHPESMPVYPDCQRTRGSETAREGDDMRTPTVTFVLTLDHESDKTAQISVAFNREDLVSIVRDGTLAALHLDHVAAGRILRASFPSPAGSSPGGQIQPHPAQPTGHHIPDP